MYIDETRCGGCGVCVDVCAPGAIHLLDGIARIDAALCNGCGKCAEICPNDAIIAALPTVVPVSPARAQQLPADLAPRSMVEVETRAAVPLVGATLAFIGREVAPRVASAVVETLLNRADHAAPTPPRASVPTIRPRQRRQRAGWRRT